MQSEALQCRRSQGLSFAVGIHDLVSALAEQQDRYVFCDSVHHPVLVHAVLGIQSALERPVAFGCGGG